MWTGAWHGPTCCSYACRTASACASEKTARRHWSLFPLISSCSFVLFSLSSLCHCPMVVARPDSDPLQHRWQLTDGTAVMSNWPLAVPSLGLHDGDFLFSLFFPFFFFFFQLSAECGRCRFPLQQRHRSGGREFRLLYWLLCMRLAMRHVRFRLSGRVWHPGPWQCMMPIRQCLETRRLVATF